MSGTAPLQPHNGFIWNSSVTTSFVSVWPALQPHNGFIWNRRTRDGPREQERASTPQRVHLERSRAPSTAARLAGFNPTTGSSGTRVEESLHGWTRCFNPTTGSSGTTQRPTMFGERCRLQPHNGFIWNRRLPGRPGEVGAASTPQRVHLELGTGLLAFGQQRGASTPQRVLQVWCLAILSKTL